MFVTLSVTTHMRIICCCQLDGTLNRPEDNPLGMSVRVFTEMFNSERKIHPVWVAQSTGLGPCPSEEENGCIHFSLLPDYRANVKTWMMHSLLLL